MDGDYFLNNQEKAKVISRLKSIKFNELKINGHYYNKFKLPRHGVDLAMASSHGRK